MKFTPYTADIAEAFLYDPEEGTIRNAVDRNIKSKAFEKTGFVDKGGYTVVWFKGRRILAHRLAWRLYHGEWPIGEIDHISGDRSDNRISNLRCCKKSQNAWNRKASAKNRSGLKGVTFLKKSGRWRSTIQKDGKVYGLGSFQTPEEAHHAYVIAAKNLHGEFSRF